MSNTKIALGYVGTDDTIRPDVDGLYRLVHIEGEGPKLLAKDVEGDIDMSAVLVPGDITGTNVTVTGGENKALGDVTISLPQSVAPGASPTFNGLTINSGSVSFAGATVLGLNKAMVGLGDVDNTPDAGKPVSTAQQTALNAKAPVNNPTFTGTVSLPPTNINNRRVANRTAFLSLIAGNTFIGMVAVDSDSSNDNKKTLYYVNNDLVLWILTQQV